MSKSPAPSSGPSLLDVLSVLERNVPRVVAAASLGPEVRDALSAAPDLLSVLLLSFETAERAQLIARLSCVCKEAGACLRGDPSRQETRSSPPRPNVALAKANALKKIVPLLIRSGVLATALEHPPALACLLHLASSDTLASIQHSYERKTAKGAETAEWLSLAERIERASTSTRSDAAAAGVFAATTGLAMLGPLPAMCVDAADRFLPPQSEDRLRAGRARRVARSRRSCSRGRSSSRGQEGERWRSSFAPV